MLNVNENKGMPAKADSEGKPILPSGYRQFYLSVILLFVSCLQTCFQLLE